MKSLSQFFWMVLLIVSGLFPTIGNSKNYQQSYSLSVENDQNPLSDFKISLDFETIDGDVCISLPIINFNVLNANGGIVKSRSKKPLPQKLSRKLFKNQQTVKFQVANDDAYVTSYEGYQVSPLPVPLNNFEITLTKNGELTITGPNQSLLPTGVHSILSTTFVQNKSTKTYVNSSSSSEFQIFLQMVDSAGFPYPDQAPFPITVSAKLFKGGSWAIVEVPAFTFQTFVNQFPAPPGFPDYVPTGLTGGFVNTAYNALPKNFHPALDQAKLIAGGNSGLQNLVLSINRYGQLSVYGAGSPIQAIPPGTIQVEATKLYYKIYDQKNIYDLQPQNFIIQPAFTNMTQFTNNGALENALLNSHVNDQWDGLAAWSWTDNSAQVDKVTTNLSDAYVCFADLTSQKIKKQSNESSEPPFSLRTPLNLSNNGTNVQVQSTAVAINRVNPNNVVVSWAHRDRNIDSGEPYVAVSVDYGNTFGTPFSIDPTYFVPDVHFESVRGVIADKFGNFWLVMVDANIVTGTSNVRIYVSSDSGNSWLTNGQPLFQTIESTPASGTAFSYGQITIGNDGAGNYGAFWTAEYFDADGNLLPYLGFIPTTGLGEFPSATNSALAPYNSFPETFLNVMSTPNPTVNNKGEVFVEGWYYSFYNYAPNTFGYKPAGALSTTLSEMLGPYAQYNNFNNTSTAPASFPGFPYFEAPYFPISPTTVFYDERRKCLYAVSNENDAFDGQNYNLYLQVSFNKGNTWSRRINIASTTFQNRGSNTAHLNPQTHEMFFGFYDSRNIDTNPPPGAGPYSSVQYYGAYLSKQQLDHLVNKLRKGK